MCVCAHMYAPQRGAKTRIWPLKAAYWNTVFKYQNIIDYKS